MDVIGFTDEEINKLNNNNNSSSNNSSRSKQPTRISVQRKERTSYPAPKNVNHIGQINGASLSKPPADNSNKESDVRSRLEETSPPSHTTPDPCECDGISPDSDVTTAVQTNESVVAMDTGQLEDDNPFKSDNQRTNAVQSSDQNNSSSQNQPDFSCQKQPDFSSQKQPVTEQKEHTDGSSDVQLSKLQQLQMAQAKLELENKQKQKELKETISEKFTKTSEQAELLRTLQGEVACVEREMSCDISILRDRIDHCNRRYCEARKRHEQAEQEYVAAKLDLHNCEELKEGLQEHLFTIIQLNETKKSEKLEELYNKLQNLNFE